MGLVGEAAGMGDLLDGGAGGERTAGCAGQQPPGALQAGLDGAQMTHELAQVACVSVFHFGRVFHREIGATPHRYVMGRRLKRAKRMVLETDIDLTSIALACGFASHSHFSACFRSAVGDAPGRWRQSMRS